MDRNELKKLKETLIDLQSFQNYVIKHKITSADDFSKHSSTLYKLLNSRGYSRKIVYYGKDKPSRYVPKRDYSLFNTLKSFQSYIIEYKITSPSKFIKKDEQLYSHMVYLGFNKQVIYYNSTKIHGEIVNKKDLERSLKKNKYKSLDNLQKLITAEGIVSELDLLNKHPDIYYIAKKEKIMCKLIFPGNRFSLWTRRMEAERLTSFNDFQEFIDLWGFKKMKEIYQHNYRVYNKLCNLGYNKSLKLGRSYTYKSWSVDKFQEILDLYGISSMCELKDTIYNLYVYISLTEIYKMLKIKLEEESIFRVDNSIDFFQELIYNLRIEDELELKSFYEPLYTELYKLGFEKHVIYYIESNKSKMELEVEEFLVANEISFVCQKKFDFLGGYLSLDFFLPDFNIAIECQGAQHFMPIDYFGGKDRFIIQKERDMRKYKECLKNNITILYYSNKTQLISGNRKTLLIEIPKYFSKVSLDIAELYEEIQQYQKKKQL